MAETTTVEPEPVAETGRAEAHALGEPGPAAPAVREAEGVRDEPAEAREEEEQPSRGAPPAPEGGRLLPASESTELRHRWESIQASFIDSPKESVEEADRLVADLTDRIAEGFRAQRSELEARWHRGEKISTEALRQSLQRYRAFFDRLLNL